MLSFWTHTQIPSLNILVFRYLFHIFNSLFEHRPMSTIDAATSCEAIDCGPISNISARTQLLLSQP